MQHPLDIKVKHAQAVNRYMKKRKGNDLKFHMKTIFYSRRNAARKKNIEFTVTFEDIPFTNSCPILGISFEYGGDRCSSPTLDRIDIKRGYVPGNVRWLSHRANRWKNNMSYEDVKILLDNFYKIV